MKKASAKKTRKILPLSLYDIPGMESWLEEQANAGLFPVYLDTWATFEPAGIPGTRFRLEPWGKMGTEPAEEQLELCNPYILLAIATLFLYWLWDRRDHRILEKTCRALKAGLAPPPSDGPSPALIRRRKITIILVPILIPVLLYAWLGNLGKLTVPVQEFTRPYVALQDLEQVELISSREVFGPSSFHKDDNQARLHISLLAPVWYSVAQNACGAAEGDYTGYSPDPDGGRFRYSPSLDAAYFRLLFPAMARPVAESQMDQDRAVNVYWTYEELSYPGLDFVILATEPRGVYQGLALGKGNRVAVFHYGGVERLTDHLKLLASTVM